jgi:hypothetical protein
LYNRVSAQPDALADFLSRVHVSFFNRPNFVKKEMEPEIIFLFTVFVISLLVAKSPRGILSSGYQAASPWRSR